MELYKRGILVALIITLALPVHPGMTCDQYPEEDLIILLDESVNTADNTLYLTNSQLPEDWYIMSQGDVPEEDFLEWARRSSVSVGYYKKTIFKGAYSQAIRGTDGEEVYVLIEAFTTPNSADVVYRHYRDLYSEARNVYFKETEDYGVKGFTSKIKAHDYDYKFIDHMNRLIHVIGANQADVKYVAGKYSDLQDALVISEKRRLKLLVCKSQTKACTQTFYFNPATDVYDLESCITIHDGNTIQCPEARMQKYSNSIQVPFPSCEKGDVLDITYTKKSSFHIDNMFWSPEDFYFERAFPAEKLRLVLKVPEDVSIEQHYTGGAKTSRETKYEYTTYTWEMENIQPYEVEELMPSQREALERAGYTSVSSWNVIRNWMGGLFSGSLDKDAVKDIAPGLVSGSDNDADKAKKIYEWVRDEIRYEESEIGYLTGYKPHQAGEVLDYKFGDCKDQTVLLISMLDSVGITAYPALVARAPLNMETPSPYEFYHAIVLAEIGADKVWLDPTCAYCPYGYIPPAEQDADVLLLSHPEKDFTKTPVNDLDAAGLIYLADEIVLNADGSAELTRTYNLTGKTAVQTRYSFEEAKGEKEERELLSILLKETCSDHKLVSKELYSPGDELLLQLKLKLECDDLASKSNEKLVYDLGGEPFYQGIIEKSDRRYPIIFDESSTIARITIMPPEGYTLNMLPGNHTEESPYAVYDIRCDVSGDEVSCVESYNTSDSRIPPGDFQEFKSFYKKINSFDMSVVYGYGETSAEPETKTNETEKQGSVDNSEDMDVAGNNESGGSAEDLTTLFPYMIALLVIALLLIGLVKSRR